MTIGSVGAAYSPYQLHTEQQAKSAGLSDGEIKNLKRVGNIECATCASRKYQDGSDEMVSFKAAAHIDPSAAAATVSAHEQEHVSNAYKDAAQNNGKVINASVQLHTSICPECGRSYVSGGTTTTQIMYKDDEYSQNAKSRDAASLIGGNIDYAC